MPSSFEKDRHARSAAPSDAVDVLLAFSAAMMRAGNTATRTRECMEAIARNMGFDAITITLSLDSIMASVRRSGERVTAMREIGPPGINVWRIAELEQLARASSTPSEIAVKLEDIELAKPLYSSAQISVAVGMASGAFAFLNGAAVSGMIAAAIGAGIGQGFRTWLARHQINQYGTAALSAIAASGLYVLAAQLAQRAGFEFLNYPAGFIASVLFLIPGFPLIAALFDLLRYQTVAAVSRFAYGVMILLAVALGLSIVITVAGVDITRQPPFELAYPLKIMLRAIASFVAACAFAMLFNTPIRAVLMAGLLALVANDLRLVLNDMGMMLAPAAFFAALVIGLVALGVNERFNIPRLAMTVAPIVIMIPGVYVFETIVLFNRGQMLEALQAAAVCGFAIGALAMGLATARFFIRK